MFNCPYRNYVGPRWISIHVSYDSHVIDAAGEFGLCSTWAYTIDPDQSYRGQKVKLLTVIWKKKEKKSLDRVKAKQTMLKLVS